MLFRSNAIRKLAGTHPAWANKRLAALNEMSVVPAGASGVLPTPSVKPLPQVLTKPSVKGADFDYPYTPRG